jgi:hypothetical protein
VPAPFAAQGRHGRDEQSQLAARPSSLLNLTLSEIACGGDERVAWYRYFVAWFAIDATYTIQLRCAHSMASVTLVVECAWANALYRRQTKRDRQRMQPAGGCSLQVASSQTSVVQCKPMNAGSRWLYC